VSERIVLILAVLLVTSALPPRVGAEEPAPPCEVQVRQREEALQSLLREKALLEEKLKAMETVPTLCSDDLLAKNVRQLQELAANTRLQRQAMADFEKYVTWMSGSLAGYEKYLQAGTLVAGVARVLPIPYAGQASLLTKFVSQGMLSLNATSVAIARDLETSQTFLARVDALHPVEGLSRAQVSEAARFADGELLRAMTDVQAKLRTTADVSASTLAFLETLNQYAGSGDDYWNKTKSFVLRKDVDKHDKSYLAASAEGLRNRVGSFNARLTSFDQTVRKDLPLIKHVAVYDDLVRELDARALQKVATR